MKINIISFNNRHSLSEDCEVISYCLKKFYRNKKMLFAFHNFQETSCDCADVNIFVGLVNNFFFKYAPINIIIIDPHKFDKIWIPYLEKCQYIICKTEFGKQLLKPFVPVEKIHVLGWKTVDRLSNTVEKTYNSFLCSVGNSVYRNVELLLDIWKEEWPELIIQCNKNYFKHNKIEKKEQKNIIYKEEYLLDKDYENFLNQHGLHICLSTASSFSNTLHNSISCKSVPIAIDNMLNRDFVTNNVSGFLIKNNKKKKLKVNFGSEYILNKDDLIETIERVIKTDELKLEEMGDTAKKSLRQSEKEFEKLFKEFYDNIWKKHREIKPLNPTYKIFDEDLPSVSIITPTRGREGFYKLTLRNFEKADYPKDKLEWIIVQDLSDENPVCIKNLLPENSNIKVIDLHENKSIGEMRNIAVENCSNDIIICMDDDDYYHPGSIKYRVAALDHLHKDIVACTTLGVLNINRIISNVSSSSFIEEYYNRAYESTFAFRKSLWENNKFLHTNIHEGRGLIENNLLRYEEIPYNSITVAFKHYGNTNERIKLQGETNGCHFNFSEELFDLISNLDKIDDDIDKKNMNKPLLKKTRNELELEKIEEEERKLKEERCT